MSPGISQSVSPNHNFVFPHFVDDSALLSMATQERGKQKEHISVRVCDTTELQGKTPVDIINKIR